MTKSLDAAAFIGRSPETLSRSEWRRVHGAWAAFELYSPETTPLRRIVALGASVEECARQLKDKGLDPRNYEFIPLISPLPL